MSDHVTVDRLQFALTVTFHYLFPILTMGLALFIAYLKTVAHLRGREDHDQAARFWIRIFAINFAVGVVTGIPLEFQFGTNWAVFSAFAGGVIGQTLALEGMFAFFLESVFLGLLLAGPQRVGARLHWIAALAVFAGSWLSGFFIVATNAWMQHPVAYAQNHGRLQLASFWHLLGNPWLPWQYAHTMLGAALSGAFALAAIGALYTLLGRHEEFARLCLTVGVVGALAISILQIFPTGDSQARTLARRQPAAFAAAEGLFHTEKGAPLVIIGVPDVEQHRLESTVAFPRLLSFLTSRRWNATTPGLDTVPRDRWPDSVPLVYYAYHVMVGLGTLLLVLAAVAVLLLRRGRLFRSRTALWALLLAFPLTYVANVAGWTVAETGRQPWIVYGLQRTSAGASPAGSVPSGEGLLTLLGFAGVYLLVGLLYVLFILRAVAAGPAPLTPPPPETPTATPTATAGVK